MTCSSCAAELEDRTLSCPQCRRLIHSVELDALSQRAREAWRVGKFAEEREAWREALALLPPETVQYRSIDTRLEELDRQIGVAQHSAWKKASMGIGPAIALLLTKGKFLLLGLTKIGTLLSMLASLGVYWSMYGWALALGLIVSIYIHEMGHVAAIKRFGLQASAPMFIPGLGAFIQLRGVSLPPIPDARVGLAGPIYGLGAALLAFGAYRITGMKIWGVIANFGAVINLFNLIPVWQLDGSRGVHSFTRFQRAVVLAAAATLWLLTSAPMLLLICMGAIYRLFTKDWQDQPDQRGLAQFLLLLCALSAVVFLSGEATSISR